MIGVLTGIVLEVQPESIVLDVGGVGYEVQSHGRTIAALQAESGVIRVYTDLQLRNEVLRLYGFPNARERDWFRLLCGVHHVGARGAMSILGSLGVEALADAVALGNATTVQRAPGIGKRIAERVVMELEGKAPPSTPGRPASGAAAVQSDAMLALAGLGFAGEVAGAAVGDAMRELPGAPLEEVIRAALQRLGPRNG